MFDGYSMWGNIEAVGYYVFFICTGIYVTHRLLWNEKYSIAFQCLMGSVAGVVALQWFPLLFAFPLGFTMAAHLLALALQVAVCVVVTLRTKVPEEYRKTFPYRKLSQWKRFLKENPVLLCMAITFIYFVYCVSTHTIKSVGDGSMHTGQCTYGDMNLHLSIITSIANQEMFPPEYSMLPGNKLCYPFLCDSISSSLYQFGCSLRLAYMLPMFVSILQVFGGFYCFIKYWLKRQATAFIAWVLFFWNGGLGFMYYRDAESIRKIFTEFYFTPTNLGEHNLRWVQVIVDMLIPQRSTLFGWAVLFPLMTFLYRAVQEKKTKLFAMAGIVAGAMPMLHTHSFLALGMICTMWLVYDCKSRDKVTEKKDTKLRYASIIGLIFFSILQALNVKNGFAENHGIAIMGVGVGVLLLWIFNEIMGAVGRREFKKLLMTWGIFLGLVLLFAIPQICIWTLSQTSGGNFVHSHFNWSNNGEQYIWFYLKNIGLALFLFIPAAFFAAKKDLQVASPYLLIWFVAELVAFQPNEYDNNKLLYMGSVFIIGIAADGLVKLFSFKWKMPAKVVVGVCLFLVGTVSAFLTMGREWVSDYELYGSSAIEGCRYIETMTEPEDIILTSTAHNSPVPPLTGRSIVCGSSTFLYFHGLDYGQAEQDVNLMYTNPAASKELFSEYGVSYIFLSAQEYGTFEVDVNGLWQIADVVWQKDDVSIWKVKEE
ncbi:MAG: hypothetical protein J1E62_06115 [Lachnospiraceae bacterium]|nr:hypothetical protein [Lachnospiraceae bacterium]